MPFCLVDFVTKFGGGGGCHIDFYMCAYICNVRDINFCNLTEPASTSEYWDSPGIVLYFRIQDSRFSKIGFSDC